MINKTFLFRFAVKCCHLYAHHNTKINVTPLAKRILTHSTTHSIQIARIHSLKWSQFDETVFYTMLCDVTLLCTHRCKIFKLSIHVNRVEKYLSRVMSRSAFSMVHLRTMPVRAACCYVGVMLLLTRASKSCRRFLRTYRKKNLTCW